MLDLAQASFPRGLQVIGFGLALTAAAAATVRSEPAPERADLTALSLDELVNVKVSTVSRKPEPWWSVASGVDVVTGNDIRRAGAESLPDALRLAAGVHVGQPSARSWAISIRGMNVLAANKVAVAMDGRSLFTPFFSGVAWDAQDTLLDDIDRIEVVRGPVGALWGAYAVNGFIQILTKPAWDTQGLLVSAGRGTEDPALFGFRYGGKMGKETFYRVYGKYFQTNWTYSADGTRPQPATDFLQTGFRVDSRRAHDATITVQGDFYTNRGLPLDRVQAQATGANVLGRWQRAFSDDSELELQGYLEHTDRLLPQQFDEKRTTGSLSAKYRFVTGRHSVVLGADTLVSADDIGNIGIAKLVPPQRTIHTVGTYVQDAVRLAPKATLVLGLKAEQSSFAGVEVQPAVRLSVTPSASTSLWGAVARGVRTPVRIDEDLVFDLNGVTIVEANDDFKTETALAWELGVRHRPASWVTLGLSGFTYSYNDLRSTEPLGAAPLPVTFKNMLNAQSFGAEATVMYQPVSRLFIKGSYRLLDLEFSKDAGSVDATNGSSEGNDPKHVVSVGAYFVLPANLELDAFLRTASDLPNPELKGYTTVDARLGWTPSNSWEFSVAGRNLLDEQHPEFITTNSLNEEIHRRVTAKVTFRR